jgi:hypothetical protein
MSVEYFCNVKYIDIASACDEGGLHNINEFVRHEEVIGHTSYNGLVTTIFETQLPQTIRGVYKCIQPLALYHEVLWSSGITIVNGVCIRQVTGHDQLHHAIEAGEYQILQTEREDPLSICVDITRMTYGRQQTHGFGSTLRGRRLTSRRGRPRNSK